MKRVKLLNTNLIRTFGGVVVTMDDGQAERYKNIGFAKIIETVDDPYKKAINGGVDPNDKSKWIPPESKLFDDNKSNEVYPKPDDKLFVQIN
jgi:hypothetical protein